VRIAAFTAENPDDRYAFDAHMARVRNSPGLRWHYFTDTVGGVALGTGTVLALAFLIDLVAGVMRSWWVGSGILRRDRAVSASGRPAGEG
jgi:hypothetical protein